MSLAHRSRKSQPKPSEASQIVQQMKYFVMRFQYTMGGLTLFGNCFVFRVKRLRGGMWVCVPGAEEQRRSDPRAARGATRQDKYGPGRDGAESDSEQRLCSLYFKHASACPTHGGRKPLCPPDARRAQTALALRPVLKHQQCQTSTVGNRSVSAPATRDHDPLGRAKARSYHPPAQHTLPRTGPRAISLPSVSEYVDGGTADRGRPPPPGARESRPRLAVVNHSPAWQARWAVHGLPSVTE